MECKFRTGFLIFLRMERINRYIMECKLSARVAEKEGVTGINRYIMECKFDNSARNWYNNWWN